ncbi:putative GEM-like protein 8 [Olea europaea var. sylvestris]|uniref:putative GEM-like protein 8 n=1 Tax=Olea europaea var. sylvestris TaxID=158386 RepID=UPI000C1D1043|nr:putative GEM-like protein 8 [Olea europaea var. sylvestris]
MNGSKFEDHGFPRSPLMCSNTSSEPVSSTSSVNSSPAFTSSKGKPPTGRNHYKFERKANSLAYRIREHVRLGPKISETVKGKLSVGAKIIKKGGRENIFREMFGVIEGEKVLKASQCYLSTTAGPIAGILFISTEKIAFCSERSITLQLSSGSHFRTPYKLSVPVKKIKRANESGNMDNPAQKYIEIVTEDDFEFWFMGFVRYEKAFMNLQKAISLSQCM